MYNDFVILGPKNDPAHLAKSKSAVDAMKRIASHRAIFVSRGDDSGTNKKEIRLWKAAGIKPHGSWYRAAGQGMGKVIQMADELNAYTLSDRGTWLAFKAKPTSRLTIKVTKVCSIPTASLPSVKNVTRTSTIKPHKRLLTGSFRKGARF